MKEIYGKITRALQGSFTKITAAIVRLHADSSPTWKGSYHIHIFQDPDGEGWLARVGEYDILTQGSTLAEAAWMAEGLIRCHEGKATKAT